MPISLVWWIFIIQSSADRLISISFLGATATGFYGLGVALVSAILLLPQALGSILYPRVNEKMGSSADLQSISALTLMPARMLSLALPIAMGLLLMLSPILYHEILPKYNKGLAVGQLLIAGSFFLCLINTGVNCLIAANKQKRVLVYALISLVTNITLNSVLALSGFGIEGIAVGSSFCGAILTTLVWQDVFQSLGYSRLDSYKQIATLYLPFVILVIFAGCCYIFIPHVLIHYTLSTAWVYAGFLILFGTASFAIPPMKQTVKELYFAITRKMAREAA